MYKNKSIQKKDCHFVLTSVLKTSINCNKLQHPKCDDETQAERSNHIGNEYDG